MDRVDFICDRGREFTNRDTIFKSKRIKCPFRFNATKTIKQGGWGVKVQNGRHNHPLLTTDLGAKYFGRLKKVEKTIVNEYVDLDVTPKNTLIFLLKKDPKNATTIGHVYRQRHHYRKSRKGPRTDPQELMRLIEEHNYLCWSRKVGGTEIISDLMWAHPTSIKLLRLFPKVLILDATYKTNKYYLPLLQIIGVTNTEMSFQVAFAFLGHELSHHFTWALEQLKGVCELHFIHPEIFLTDRELGSMAGIAYCLFNFIRYNFDFCYNYFDMGFYFCY